MLVISRGVGEAVMIDGRVVVEVVEVGTASVKVRARGLAGGPADPGGGEVSAELAPGAMLVVGTGMSVELVDIRPGKARLGITARSRVASPARRCRAANKQLRSVFRKRARKAHAFPPRASA